MVRFTFILLLTFSSLYSFAQSKWSYGYILSPDAAFQNKKEIPKGTYSNLLVRYTAGINFVRHFNSKVGFITGLWISQRGYAYSGPKDNSINNPDPIYPPSHYVFTETYLEVPLLVKYSTPLAKKWSFYKTSGIILSTPLFGTNATQWPKIYGESRADLSKWGYRELYVLATISAGLAYQCSERTQLTIEPNIKYSLNTQYTNDPQHMREYSLGIRFGLYRSF